MASLKLGNWEINGNGFKGALAIKQIDAQGNIVGGSTVYDHKLLGFWDEGSRKITFMRVVNAADPASLQIYTGYLMGDNATLAGSFVGFGGSGATAQRSVFGWFARFPPVIK